MESGVQSMKKPIPSLTLGVCLVALSAGVAFANNLHDPTINGGVTVKGQTGTGSTTPVSGCGGGTTIHSNFKPNNGALAAGSTAAVGSPFNQATGGSKVYAGAGAGNLSNPHANSQYDNACAQHQLH
jgi:hypothetical protein